MKEKVEITHKSYFTTDSGPSCSCGLIKFKDFAGFLPLKLCAKYVTEMKLKKPVKVECSSICGCGIPHFYNATINPDNVVQYEPIDVKIPKRKFYK